MKHTSLLDIGNILTCCIIILTSKFIHLCLMYIRYLHLQSPRHTQGKDLWFEIQTPEHITQRWKCSDSMNKTRFLGFKFSRVSDPSHPGEFIWALGVEM